VLISTPFGIQVQTEVELPVSAETLDEYYFATVNCVDDVIRDPFFMLVLTGRNVTNGGTTSSGNSPTIAIHVDSETTRDHFLQVYTHEIVHALLNGNATDADNKNHGSIYFLACVYTY